ncbi:MAG: metallophosphoesterase [Ruminococcus sp.]|nr:metallophosphoesterase [Ruminococcus sp.]MDE7225757.1 metallophosphoesterase [Ruminococcus sp.]
MRLIVISDTHDDIRAIENVFLRNSDADWFIHLGDGERELDEFLTENPEYTSKVIHVAGNCDFGSLSPGFQILPVMNHKIFITHGHLFAVKNSLEIIKRNAVENGCDIILYGHTHVRYNKFEEGLYILNPGSGSIPYDGTRPSFGTVNILPAGVVLNIADI